MPSIPENPWHDDLLDVPRALWLPHALQTVSRMGLGQELAVTHPGRPAQTVLAQASEALRTGGVGAPVAPVCRWLSPPAGASVRSLTPFPVLSHQTGRAELPIMETAG